MSNLALPPEKFALLEPNEVKGYQKWLSRETSAPLSEVLSEKLYGLFIQGKSCEEIFKSNSNLPFGSIVDARIRYNWDERRKVYLERLTGEVERRQATSQLGAIQFVSDLLTATQIVQSEKLNKYMVTRDPNDLVGVIPITNVKDYKILVEIMMILSGKSTNNSKVEGRHVIETQSNQIPMKSVNGEASTATVLATAITEDHSDFLSKAVQELEAVAPVRRKKEE